MIENSLRTYKLIDLIEGFHLLQSVLFLHEHDLLNALKSVNSVNYLATSFDLDSHKLGALLWYLSTRSDIVKNLGNNDYQLNEEYFSYRKRGFWLEQYIGAYGFDAKKIGNILRDSSATTSFVNKEKHALAYEKLNDSGFPFLKRLIEQMGVKSLLEFGCGTGHLLVNLSKDDSNFIGFGVEANPQMSFKFQKNIEKHKLSSQLIVLEGDAEKPRKIVPLSIADRVELVAAISLINSFFSGSTTDGAERVVGWLRELKTLFPGRQLLVVDYYGRLGNDSFSHSAEVLLHDWVQLFSGQGIPPSHEKDWKSIYNKADCYLLDVMEPKNSTFPYFIHLVSL